MGAVDPVEAWLGTPVVSNEARGVHEKVTDYLLRHTRLIPCGVGDPVYPFSRG